MITVLKEIPFSRIPQIIFRCEEYLLGKVQLGKNSTQKLRLMTVFLSLVASTQLNAQDFRISSDVCDSLSPTSFLIHVSGYAVFSDSLTMTVDLFEADSNALMVYSGSKDFGVSGTSSLTNFVYDPINETFSLDIGTYPTRSYMIRIRSWINGQIKEELNIDTY